MLKADERPLDVEDVVADHVGLAVSDQELEVVHGFLNVLLAQHVADQTQVDVSWKKKPCQGMFLLSFYLHFSDVFKGPLSCPFSDLLFSILASSREASNE